tara:strand:+ start:164 stop:487 length:324 start_codon:yes stop_codon:yes gene_type:complete
MAINIGDVVEFYMEIPSETNRLFREGYFRQYHTIKETGIVVSIFNESTNLSVSIKRYGGDYTIVKIKDAKIKKIPLEYKLSLISNFRPWWFNYHKNLFQSIIVEALN